MALNPRFCYTNLMPTNNSTPGHSRVKRSFLMLGLVTIGIAAAWHLSDGNLSIEGYLTRKTSTKYTWKVFSQVEVGSGAIIPGNTHVVFHLPETFTRLSREILLGQQGKKVRYWGYCFPANSTPEMLSTRTGFPGKIFLSERERALRAAALAEQNARYAPGNVLPTAEQVNELENPTKGVIRHQIDVFQPNTMCYVMSEKTLYLGLDPDGDKLNDQLERNIGTNPKIPDSDGDGLSDGTEYLYGTNPVIRDSDADGIIDGIEDANWNGRLDPGETDPRVWDTDRDGLCDGMCRIRLQKNQYFMGEDKNLNGIVDEGESDPRKESTLDNGILDEVPFLECIANGEEDCP